MGKIGENPKIGQVMPRSSATVRRTKKMTELGNSLGIVLQRG